MPPETKYCRDCDQHRPLSEFSFVVDGRRRSYCRTCYNARQRRYKRKNVSVDRGNQVCGLPPDVVSRLLSYPRQR